MAPDTNNIPPVNPPPASKDVLGQRAQEQALERQRVEKSSTSILRFNQAAIGTPEFEAIANDQTKLDLVRGIPVESGAGTLYLPEGVHEQFAALSRAREMSQADLERLRETMMRTVNDYLRRVQSAARYLSASQKQEEKFGGNFLNSRTATAAREIIASEQTIEDFRSTWLAIFDAASLLIRATSDKKTTDTVWNELKPSQGHLPSAILDKMEDALTPNDPKLLTPALRQKVLDILLSAAPLGLRFDPTLFTSIDAEISHLDRRKKELDIKRTEARRKLHTAMMGTDRNAEAVLTFATLEDGRVDFGLLKKQLEALGLVSKSSSDLAADSVAALLSDGLGRVGISIDPTVIARAIGEVFPDSPEKIASLTEDQKNALLEYIRKVQEHDNPGFSLPQIYRDTLDRQMVRQSAENLVKKHTVDVAFDYRSFEHEVDTIAAKFSAAGAPPIPSILPGSSAVSAAGTAPASPATGKALLASRVKTHDGVGAGEMFLTPDAKNSWVTTLLNPAHPQNKEVKAALEAAYDRAIRRRFFARKSFGRDVASQFGIKDDDKRLDDALALSSDQTLPEDWSSTKLTTLLLGACAPRASMEKKVEDYLAKNKAQPFEETVFTEFLRSIDPALTFASVCRDIGIPAGTTTMPPDWHPETLWNYLRTKDIERRTGLTVEKVDFPWQDDVKETVRVASEQGGDAVKLWWDWIASLPTNVYDDTENDEFTKVLERKDALEDAKAVYEEISTGFRDKGNEAIKEAFASLQQSQDSLDTLLQPLIPAQRTKEHIDGIRRLYTVAASVFSYLEKETNFATLRDPVTRRTAFYIAMTKGGEEAKKYLDNPQNYSFADGAALEKDNYLGRFDDAQELSGRDILLEMRQTYGVMVSPLAWLHLTRIQGPYGVPLSQGPTRVENWLSNPHLAGPALLAILQDDPMHPREGKSLRDAFITAFVTQQEVDGISPADATRHVSLLVRHLLRQSADAQLSSAQNRSPERFVDPLNMLRTGWDSVRQMLDGDGAEKALGISLIVGAGYALYKSWQAGGLGKNLIVGVPLFFGMDIALKNATGSGLLDRLGMNYMSPEQKDSAREQFLRGMADAHDRYSFLDTDLGDACVRELAHPTHPLPLADLLHWRETLHSAGGPAAFDTPGAFDFSQGAPAALRVQPIIAKMGILPAYMDRRSGVQAEAYRKLFFTFEALCVQVSQINDLGGDTLEEKAERGAALLKHRYIRFDEQYLQDTGMGMHMSLAAGPAVSILDVMVYERTTPAVTDAMLHSTFLEWMAAKIGVSKDFARDKLRQGWTWSRIQAEAGAEYASKELYPWAKNNVLSSYDTFMEWAHATYHRGYGEVAENWRTTYDMIAGICSELGLVMYYKGPGAIEWVYDRGADLVNGAGDKIHRAWLELHAHQVTGDAAELVESFIAFLATNAPMETAETLANPNVIKRDLAGMLSRVSEAPAGGYDALVEQWLIDIGVAQKYGSDLISATGTTPRERMMKVELLKREVFSWVAAMRLATIEANMNTPQYTIGSSKLVFAFPSLDATTITFQTNSPPNPDEEAYLYMRSQYNNPVMLSLIGQERTVHGSMEDYGALYPGTLTGTPVAGLAYITDWFLRDGADEYTKKSLSSYIAPLDKEAKNVLTDAEYEQYKHYLNTLALNVLLEASLQNGDQTVHVDLALPIRSAKDYLYHLRTKRGNTPDPSTIDQDVLARSLLQKFNIPPVSSPPSIIEAIQQHSAGKWLLKGASPPNASSTTAASSILRRGSSVASSRRAGAGSATPPLAAVPQSQINALLHSPNMMDVNYVQSLLASLPSADSQQQTKIRTLFENNVSAVKSSRNNDLQLLYLLGINQGSVQSYLPTPLKIAKGQNGRSLVANTLGKFSDAEGQKRTTFLMDVSVSDDVLPLAKRIAALQPGTLSANTALVAEVGELMNQASNEDLRDSISLMMEYIFCEGDWKGGKTFTEYNTFLKNNGIDPMPSTDPATRTTNEPASHTRFGSYTAVSYTANLFNGKRNLLTQLQQRHMNHIVLTYR